MLYFSPESDHGSDIIPARALPNSEDVAIVQRQIRRSVPFHSRRKLDVHVLGNRLGTVTLGVACQVGNRRIRAFLETAGDANQVFHMHVRGKGITAWFGDLAL